MKNNIFCIEVNQLSEFSMISGTQETLEFYFYYEDGTPLDLTSSTARWRLCYLGQQDYPVVDIEAEIFDGNGIVVQIPSEQTQNLQGKFIQQPVLVDYSGKEYIYQQGIITIIPKIQSIN